MTDTSPPPDWQLPRGVNRSLWEYAHTARLATEEDEYFDGHPLFRTDSEALTARFVEPGSLVDLGCGVGRHSLQFARRRFPVTAVDLSAPMLRQLASKARAEGLKIDLIQANLCRLGCLPDGSFDYALSMFSTLGMIRGVEARRQALLEAHRILKPGGRLALHAHNAWLNLRDPQGRSWLMGQALKWFARRPGVGDRRMTYRGIPEMEVHLFSWHGLSGEIRRAGFRIEEVLPIDAVRSRPIAAPRLGHGLRAGGWIVFASR